MNTGAEAVFSSHGLVTTPAVDGNCRPCYALEGSIFIAGAAIQWLRDELQIIRDAGESENIALSVPDTGGVYFVPAFVGLGTPHWNPEARGTITGLTRGTQRSHIIRAALESMAYQSSDVIDAMEKDSGIKIERLSVDGGAAANNFLLQFQADVLNRPVKRPGMVEITALGAAALAALGAGIWKISDLQESANRNYRHFSPQIEESVRRDLLDGWQKALRQTTAE
jgi:glycerol kinase